MWKCYTVDMELPEKMYYEYAEIEGDYYLCS